MKTVKYLLLALVLLNFALPSFAMAIFSPSQVPANVNWSFYVTLDSISDRLDVFFDDRLVVTVYSNRQVVKDPVNSALVLDAFVFDNALYVSHMGLSKGTYEIKASYSGSEGEKSFVEVFEPIDAELETQINTRLEEALTDKEQLLRQINTLEQDLLEKNSQLEELKGQLEQARNELTETKNNFSQTLSELDSRVTGQSDNISGELSGLTQRVGELETEVFPEPVAVEEQQFPGSNLVSGLSTFAQKNWIGIFLLLIATVVVVIVVARKTFLKQDSVYDDFGSGKGKEGTIKPEEDEEEFDDEPEQEKKSKGKWAFKE